MELCNENANHDWYNIGTYTCAIRNVISAKRSGSAVEWVPEKYLRR